jgi:uncharacterized protein
MICGRIPFATGVSVVLNLQELELRPVKFDVELPAGEIEFDGRLRQASSLRARGIAELVNPSIGELRVQGHLAVTAEAPCDRCLETAVIPVDKSFDLSYYPAEQLETAGEDEIDEDASEVAYYEGSHLELNDILREVVLLAMPMQLVCSEACKGICPTCGQNRNLQDCRCAAQKTDDRWNKLMAFRAELSPEH